MRLKHLCLLLLAALVVSVASQNPDELHIPVENDNQFPPDNHFELDGSIAEGSSGGAIEEPVDATTLPTTLLPEDVQLTSMSHNEQLALGSNTTCPNSCVCHIEANSNNFIVECSGSDLIEIPKTLDPKIERSSGGETVEPIDATTLPTGTLLEDVQLNSMTDNADYSGSDLTELPKPLDPQTEGSVGGETEEPVDATTLPTGTLLKELKLNSMTDNADYSGSDLTELPKPLDAQTEGNSGGDTEEPADATTLPTGTLLDELQFNSLTGNEDYSRSDLIELPKPLEPQTQGNGGGETEEPVDATTVPTGTLLEDVQLNSMTDNEDYSGSALAELPKSLDPQTEGSVGGETEKLVDATTLPTGTLLEELQFNSLTGNEDYSGSDLTELPKSLDPQTEGSVGGETEEPVDATTLPTGTLLEELQLNSLIGNEDYSGSDLTELPQPLDPQTEGSVGGETEEPVDATTLPTGTSLEELQLNSLTGNEDYSGPNLTELPKPLDTQTEGSGDGAIKEPVDVTTPPATPLLEDVVLTSLANEQLAPGSDTTCPNPCVCHMETNSTNFIVDCSGYGLTEFPRPLDPKTTTLNLENNKLNEISKEVSSLKNLKFLNANNNSITDLASGSISELPELITLKLGNNRLIEFPKDLKNGFGFTKLEELDLGGNDITALTSETFLNFTTLRKLTLPTSTALLLDDLCVSLKEHLETVCTGSCISHSFKCPDAHHNIEDELLEAILPGTIAITSVLDDADPAVKTEVKIDDDKEETVKQTVTAESATTEGVSFRSVVNKIPEEVAHLNAVVDIPNEVAGNTDTDVTVGATTSGTKTGGVDKSVIGMVVAGMVLVVAGITIKKNWSSIKRRFSSTPRSPNNHAGTNANGTSPEEVPLQEKLPV